jgi:ketosteroid isomerase-like protein
MHAPTAPPTGTTRRVALEFLSAYWRGELPAALALCRPDAVIELPKSLSIVTPAPLREVLPGIFADVFRRFVGGKFDIEIERTVAERDVALVEYRATGDLQTGLRFDCRYAVVLQVADERVLLFRQYTDTQYITAALLS